MGYFRAGLEALPASPRPLEEPQAAQARFSVHHLFEGASQRLQLLSGGAVLASAGGKDAAIHLFALRQDLPLTPVPALRGHSEAVTALAALVSGGATSPLLASGSRDRTVRVWDTRTSPSPLAVLRGGASSAVSCLAFLPAPLFSLAAAYADGSLRLWESFLDGSEPDLLLPATGDAVTFLYSLPAPVEPTGAVLVSCSAAGRACLWDARGRVVGELLGHGGEVTSALLLGDGRLATGCSGDGLIRVFNLEDDAFLSTPSGGSSGEPRALARALVAPCCTLHADHRAGGRVVLCAHPSPLTVATGLCSGGSEGAVYVWGAREPFGQLLVTSQLANARVGAITALSTVGDDVVVVGGGEGVLVAHFAGFSSREVALIKGDSGGGASAAAVGVSDLVCWEDESEAGAPLPAEGSGGSGARKVAFTCAGPGGLQSYRVFV